MDEARHCVRLCGAQPEPCMGAVPSQPCPSQPTWPGAAGLPAAHALPYGTAAGGAAIATFNHPQPHRELTEEARRQRHAQECCVWCHGEMEGEQGRQASAPSGDHPAARPTHGGHRGRAGHGTRGSPAQLSPAHDPHRTLCLPVPGCGEVQGGVYVLNRSILRHRPQLQCEAGEGRHSSQGARPRPQFESMLVIIALCSRIWRAPCGMTPHAHACRCVMGWGDRSHVQGFKGRLGRPWSAHTGILQVCACMRGRMHVGVTAIHYACSMRQAHLPRHTASCTWRTLLSGRR